jgi:hypothetical protein
MAGRQTRRRFVTAIGAIALAGCQTGTPVSDPQTPTTEAPPNPARGDISQQGDLRLTSSAFADGEAIPAKYGRNAENVNPPLSIAGVPTATASLAIVVDDPDAVEPAGKVWLHWFVWNIPPDVRTIPEDWTPKNAVEGENDFGESDYGGPAPPDTAHMYRFKCYALDTKLDVPASASIEVVGKAMAGHVLAQTQLTGTYSPQDD